MRPTRVNTKNCVTESTYFRFPSTQCNANFFKTAYSPLVVKLRQMSQDPEMASKKYKMLRNAVS